MKNAPQYGWAKLSTYAKFRRELNGWIGGLTTILIFALPFIGHGVWLYNAVAQRDLILIVLAFFPFAMPVTIPVGLYTIFFGFPL